MLKRGTLKQKKKKCPWHVLTQEWLTKVFELNTMKSKFVKLINEIQYAQMSCANINFSNYSKIRQEE